MQVGQGQQQNFQNSISGGLGTAQGNSQGVFDTAFGGYKNLLNSLQNPQSGGGGGGNPALSAAQAAIAGMSGPGNPWAGQLGADIRTRENSVLPGFYDRIKAEQTRLQNVQGGYNPGYTSQMAKLARDQAHQAQEGVLNTEIKLGEKSAAAQAAQAQFALQQQGMLASLARGGGGGGGGSADDNFRQQMAVLGAMGGLRGQAPGEVGMYLNSGLGNIGLGNQQAGQFAQYNPATVPGWQKALGAVGGVAGGILGSGFNPFGGGGNKSGGQGQYYGGWA
jgi:hypothetical protein